jgi:hypothetical protein
MPTQLNSPIYNWGATDAECAQPQPCDRVLTNPDDTLFRAIAIDAPPAVTFRWLCQLRAAPYSYDWIDNRGRQSPLTLTPGLDQLAIGQRIMGVFRLADFEPGRHLTLARGQSRLLVKLLVRYPPGLLGTAMHYTIPTADLIMMRKQLLNLKDLAEAQARS